MSQKTSVLSYLRAGNPITPVKAIHEFNAFRLADIIFKLRAEGHNIRTTIKRTYGGKPYGEYTLI